MTKTFVVKLNNALSPTGSAFIGPVKAAGFSALEERDAHLFDSKIEAERYADHFRGQWRGMCGFDPSDIEVVEVSAARGAEAGAA